MIRHRVPAGEHVDTYHFLRCFVVRVRDVDVALGRLRLGRVRREVLLPLGFRVVVDLEIDHNSMRRRAALFFSPRLA